LPSAMISSAGSSPRSRMAARKSEMTSPVIGQPWYYDRLARSESPVRSD
jgi:hypothetical protein